MLNKLYPQPDIIAALLASKKSPKTRKEYSRDFQEFTQFLGYDPHSFLQLSQLEATTAILAYRQFLYDKGLKVNTVNRKIAAIKSLVNFAVQMGISTLTLAGIKADQVITYRDTTGIPGTEYKKILALPNRDTFSGLRDYAILRLLWDLALRRSEIEQINLGDVNLRDRSLLIVSKGRQDQQKLTLPRKSVEAIRNYLELRGYSPAAQPLFIRLSYKDRGERLTSKAIYRMVRSYAEKAGIEKVMSPHRVRHSSITHALDKGMSIRDTQKFSRHKDANTLFIYDDNRLDSQGNVAEIVSDI